MSKLGNCTVTIEHHLFDAVIYVVRESMGPTPTQYRHPNQNPQKPPALPQVPPYYNSPQMPQHLVQGSSYPQPAPSKPGVERMDQPVRQPASLPPIGLSPVADSTNSHASNFPEKYPPLVGTASSAPPRPASPDQLPSPTPTPKPPSTDPVIQMLATRAASDPDLKSLMKVVASSKATPDQLKAFQGQIDELNRIIRSHEAERAQHERDVRQTLLHTVSEQRPLQVDRPNDSGTPSRTSTPTQFPPPPYYPSHQKMDLPPYINHHHHQPPPPPATVGPLVPGSVLAPIGYHQPQARTEARIKHIILEFTTPAAPTQTATQDRFFFPEYAVLDTPVSGRGLEMVCSFFVIRTGAQIIAAQTRGGASTDVDPALAVKWNSMTQYYQPVTMTLRSPAHRTLETIARSARPLPEVQAFMRDVMREKTKAPRDYLVPRLPRETSSLVDGSGDVLMADAGAGQECEDASEFVDSGVEFGSVAGDDELKDFYGI